MISIVFGVGEKPDWVIETTDLSELKDKADINDDLARYISTNLDYEVYDFNYDASEYKAVEGKKFNHCLFIIHQTD